MIRISYFVVQVPKSHIFTLTECVQNSDNIISVKWVVKFDISWALNPLGIMNPWNWIWLFSWFIGWVPAIIKKHQNCVRVVTFKDSEVFPDVFEEFGFVVEEGFNMEEGSEFWEAELIGLWDFHVDGVEIKTVPHLNFVDGIGGDIIDTCRPIEFIVPIPSLLFSPSWLSGED